MRLPNHVAFSLKYNGFARDLKTPVKITEKFVSSTSKIKLTEFATTGSIQSDEYLGLWDTGATSSCITRKVVGDNSLNPVGIQEVVGAYGGKNIRPVYLICLYLPNGMFVENIQAIEAELENLDALIGMDVISLGDFSISNIDNKTSFSFRFPSIIEADFVREYNHSKDSLPQPFPKTHREKPCLCGSGKKYKKCHGA